MSAPTLDAYPELPSTRSNRQVQIAVAIPRHVLTEIDRRSTLLHVSRAEVIRQALVVTLNLSIR